MWGYFYVTMFYIYIIYSVSSNLYYVGYTSNFELRIIEHNTQQHFITFTSKHRPWIPKALFKCSEIELEAIKIERFIKKQKSRKLIELLCNPQFIPTGFLAQLVRVPKLRD